MKFNILKSDGLARTGEISTSHGVIKTPAFMPIATRGAVRRLSFDAMKNLGNDIFLANTYHLLLRPGSDVIRDLGGLHGFTGYKGPWITDSGGFQVYSLSKMVNITDEGVVFQSHIDGSRVSLTPQKCMEIQTDLASDICMTLDVCVGSNVDFEENKEALRRTHLWAEICLEHRPPQPQNLYGIVQGGMDLNLRSESRDFFAGKPFDGLAMGGLAVGEGHDTMLKILEQTPLPDDKPRYLMGVGWPKDIFAAVELGYDQFDCVIPSRNGRNGTALTSHGKLNIKRKEFQRDNSPIEHDCMCPTCQQHSRGYLHHLLHVHEVLGGALVSLHNLHFYEKMMSGIRSAIESGEFSKFRGKFLEKFDG